METYSYKDLHVWQKSMDLVVEIYKITNSFPKTEEYALVSQMRRAAISIPSNIAEGNKRKHLPEYLHFLSFAFGSGAELETQIEICKRLSQLNKLDYNKAEGLLEEVMKMLNVLISKLSIKNKSGKSTTYSLKPKS